VTASRLPVFLPGDSLLLCRVSLRMFILGDFLLLCCLDVGVAATASSALEVHTFIHRLQVACKPMGTGAAMVRTDWLILNSMWVAPTGTFFLYSSHV
jgi:hypothetical protein